jgi:outer membrane receptor protein involved in Fe transport
MRRSLTGVVSWYKADWLGGNHDFKGGIDYVDSWVGDAYAARPVAGDYQLQFNNGAPFQMATRNTPVDPDNKSVYSGLYFQDNWRLARRLTLSLGARYSDDNAFAPEQCREAGAFAAAGCFDKVQMNKWNEVVLRLHAAYDLFGDGKTVIKGGWGVSFTSARSSPRCSRSPPTTWRSRPGAGAIRMAIAATTRARSTSIPTDRTSSR